jgi:5-methylcytosine-specific restriction endonuclease McrA
MKPCPKESRRKKKPPVDWSGFAFPKRRVRKSGSDYKREREAVFARDGRRCVLPDCGSTCRVNMGHIKGRGRGGSDTRGNMVAMCDFCNDAMESGHLRATFDGTTPVKVERRKNPMHEWVTVYERRFYATI